MTPATRHNHITGGLLLVLILCAQPVLAQLESHDSGVYLRTHVGLSGYWGDLDDPTAEAGVVSAPALSWEFGVPVHHSFSAAAALQAGNYPRLDPSGSWHTWRFTGHVLLRYTLQPSSSMSPFAHVGGHLTTGSNSEVSSSRAYGPSLGGGIRYTVGRNLQLFAGTNIHIAFPDEALDGSTDGRPFDMLSSINVGIQFNLTNPSSPLRLAAVQGADSVTVGEEAVFTTAAENRSPQSVEYTWNLGDGSTATGPTVRHTYQDTGRYTVTVDGRTENEQVRRKKQVIAERATDEINAALTEACAQALESADMAYRTRNFATALDSLQTCLSGERTAVEQQVDAYRLRTLVQLKQGNIEEAKNTLVQLFALKPDYEADTVNDPPAYVSLVSIVKKQIDASSEAATSSP